MKKRILIWLGLLIILIGISFVSYEYFLTKKNYAFDYMNNKLYLSSNEMPEFLDEIEIKEEQEESNKKEEITNSNQQNNNNQNNDKPQEYYIGYLEIPKIKFKRGFVDIKSQDNNVDKNITIISGSKYPNVEKGNFIIAGHSGTGVHSYFKNLYKLNSKDEAYIYYKNVKYTYKIVNIYEQPKDGSIPIYRDYNKTTLTLITCTKNNKKTQTIYILELTNKESY